MHSACWRLNMHTCKHLTGVWTLQPAASTPHSAHLRSIQQRGPDSRLSTEGETLHPPNFHPPSRPAHLRHVQQGRPEWRLGHRAEPHLVRGGVQEAALRVVVGLPGGGKAKMVGSEL